MKPGAHLSFPSFAIPPVPLSLHFYCRCPACLCPAQEGDCPLQCSIPSRQGCYRGIGSLIWVMLVPLHPATPSPPCTDPSSFSAHLPPSCALTPFPSLFFLQSASLPWHDFPSWQGSRSLILHFLVPVILLSRSLLKTLAGKKVEGSSLSPHFLF